MGDTRVRVLGLDLSITATGVCLPDGSTYTVKTKQENGDERLLTIRHAVQSAVTAGVDLAVIEDLPTHAKGSGITAMVHGVVRTVLMGRGVPYVLLVPATLKAYATGKGNADKSTMAVAAFKRAGREFADDNQCDAWWLWHAGLDRYGAASFVLPAVQRARLDKVEWPVI